MNKLKILDVAIINETPKGRENFEKLMKGTLFQKKEMSEELIKKYELSELELIKKHNPNCYGSFIETNNVRTIIKEVKRDAIKEIVKGFNKLLVRTSTMDDGERIRLINDYMAKWCKEGERP